MSAGDHGKADAAHSYSLTLAAGSMLDAPTIELIDAAAAAGFDGLGLRLSGEHRIAPGATGAVRTHLDRHSMNVHDAEVYRIADGAVAPDALIAAAARIGAAQLLVVSDIVGHRRQTGADPVGDTAEQLHAVAQRCRDVGIRPALEYMAWTTPSDVGTAIALAQQTGCVLVVDVLHHTRIGAGMAEFEAIIDAGVFGWLQLCDGPARTPEDVAGMIDEARHGRLPPGEGALALHDFVSRLPDGAVVSVEVQSDELARLEPNARAARLAAAARRVLDHPKSTG